MNIKSPLIVITLFIYFTTWWRSFPFLPMWWIGFDVWLFVQNPQLGTLFDRKATALNLTLSLRLLFMGLVKSVRELHFRPLSCELSKTLFSPFTTTAHSTRLLRLLSVFFFLFPFFSSRRQWTSLVIKAVEELFLSTDASTGLLKLQCLLWIEWCEFSRFFPSAPSKMDSTFLILKPSDTFY